MAEVIAGVKIDVIQLGTHIDGIGAIVVNATAVARSVSFLMPRDAVFGVRLKFSSGGSVDVKVELEQGSVRLDDRAADTTKYAVAENSSGTTQGLIRSGITDELSHTIQFAPVYSPFARILLTGQGANAADTQLDEFELIYVKGQ